ncbi:hypothetical protein CISIN_1g046222mg [Citrus sinensis]|uniref:Uncharacterized protein n=1 Tax=Citrus sinensis TaxID=2711 RepID=A0A067H641_CITSI|nr:hypothetical protein CISIN_1g046222mg [Citrus sinensis]
MEMQGYYASVWAAALPERSCSPPYIPGEYPLEYSMGRTLSISRKDKVPVKLFTYPPPEGNLPVFYFLGSVFLNFTM